MQPSAGKNEWFLPEGQADARSRCLCSELPNAMQLYVSQSLLPGLDGQ